MMLEDEARIQETHSALIEYEYRIYVEHLDEQRNIDFQNFISNREEMREKIKNKQYGLEEEEWNEWNERYQKYRNAMERRVSKKLGFTPTDFHFWQLITHLFVHGGVAHIIGNMWFLWLVGVNIEDEWGRPFFLSFYIISGIVATLVFAIISQSHNPLIGASGAIAGVMGAFAIRHYNSKIHFLFIWFIPPIITTFPIYAGIVLPFWFLRELISAFAFSEFSNVAFWAHVGGFAFGGIVVLIIKYYGVEDKFIRPLVNNTLNIIDNKFSKAVEARSIGDIETAENLLLKKFDEEPHDIRTAEELIDIYITTDREKKAGQIAKYSLRKMRKKESHSKIILSFYKEYIKANNLVKYLNPYDFYFIADLYRKKNMNDKAAQVLTSAYKHNRDSNDAPYILLRLIKYLYLSRDIKFLKKAIYELKKRYPDMEEKAKAIIMEEKNGKRRSNKTH